MQERDEEGKEGTEFMKDEESKLEWKGLAK